MSEHTDQRVLNAMYRRWVYMLIAIAASAFLFTRPVFDFQQDKGIIYVRSFSMNQKTFFVTQTELTTGKAEITATMSVKWLYWSNKLMLWSCVAVLLCFVNTWRLWLAMLTAFIAGGYYVVLAHYALKMSDIHYATLNPNLMIILPALVIEMMILVRQNIISAAVYMNDTSTDDM